MPKNKTQWTTPSARVEVKNVIWRLLVVDDSPAMRGLIARIISSSRLPLECLFASNGQQALEMLARSPVDCLLTDVNMPGMDGEELLGVLRRHPNWRSIPVVVVSTDATTARRARMVALGVCDYLTKPFTRER